MIEKITPRVGINGAFVIKAPYDSYIPNTSAGELTPGKYYCIAVRRFDDIVDGNSNIKAVFFDSYFNSGEFTDALYQEQVDSEVSIVTLRDSSGKLYYVPDSYIESVPESLGYPYGSSYLAIQVKTHYMQLDLSSLATELEDYIQAKTGLVGNCFVMASESVTYLNENDHQAIEATRLSRITNGESPIKQVTSLSSTVATQRDIIDDLQSQIIALRAQLE